MVVFGTTVGTSSQAKWFWCSPSSGSGVAHQVVLVWPIKWFWCGPSSGSGVAHQVVLVWPIKWF
ncbi:hypothetical protein Bpfe_004944, partial [Biomphalaria pfeifferi]